MSTPVPRCVRCKSKRVARLGELYRCASCDALFDDNPDEGGDYSSRNPSARMEREERQRARTQASRQAAGR